MTEQVKTESKEITVLVVEDNVSNFVLIARMLGYLGIHCEWKTSGYEVVEYADALPKINLILMDIRLPYEDGYGALKKIRTSPRLSRYQSSPSLRKPARNKSLKPGRQDLMVFSANPSIPTVSLIKSRKFLPVIRFGN